MLRITSSAFDHQTPIPRRFTCEGDDVSPPLSIHADVSGAKSLVLIVDDPDAPDPRAPQRTWVHWVLYNLPPGNFDLAEDLTPDELPEGTREGKNDWGRTGYGGPCPPIGRHRYFHKLYALDVVLAEMPVPTKQELERAMEGHVLEHVELIGTYEKAGR